MMHITYAQKSLIVGDTVGELLAEYAAAVARANTGDTVRLKAFGADGDDVEAIFVLDSGTVLMVETANSSQPEPDNEEAVAYLREKIQTVDSPPNAGPVPDDERSDFIDFNDYA